MATNHQHDSERAPGTTPAKRTRAKKATTTAGGAAAQTPAPVADPIAQIDEILAAELQRANVIEPQMRMLLRALPALTLLLGCGLTRAAASEQWLTYPGGDGPGKSKRKIGRAHV